ncbi:protein GVQW3-like [Cryptotermes secundus]|uniref:protein GVQW3-like n=1 Tax=Cryptotermes secundus TaxID=105785 RepID=UPI000CD7D304|nr:protein GVQW3-like [Cryptotermes secundus]
MVEAVSEWKVYEWVERFQEGGTSVTDEHHSGHPCTAVSDANTAHMDALTGENRRISVDPVATMLNINVGSAYGIIHETLKFHYLCSRWVPRQLTEEQKLKRVLNCRAFSTHYHAEGGQLLARIVTEDETWVHIMNQNPKDNPWNDDAHPLLPRESSSRYPVPEKLC